MSQPRPYEIAFIKRENLRLILQPAKRCTSDYAVIVFFKFTSRSPAFAKFPPALSRFVESSLLHSIRYRLLSSRKQAEAPKSTFRSCKWPPSLRQARTLTYRRCKSTPQKTLRGCITFLIVQLSAELKRNVNRDKSAVHTPCRVKLSYVPEVREMPTLSYLSTYESFCRIPEHIRSGSDAF